MLVLPDYQFHEKLSEGRKTVLYRGLRKTDNLPVIAKKFKNPNLSESELDLLEYEYHLVKKLKLNCVSDMYSIENIGGSKVLLMEDFGAVSLAAYLQNRVLDIETFLSIAISLARALGDIHNHNVIHKDLRPANILINAETGMLKLTGFGTSAQLSRESQQALDRDLHEQTLAYISPEQTGRMNRSIDYRSDFYSLGAIYYEMLTGSPPFTTTNRTELIHAQIARKPVSLTEINTNIPIVINDIVLKLLAKSPENRYQSSRGILADLTRCLTDLNAGKAIVNFTVGQIDLPERFNPPEKLYGREKEIQVLYDNFSKVCSGATKMLLIKGPPGIGKTFLIQEIQKPLVAQKGFFISGKFDQYKGNTPYAPVVQAFQGLLRHVLTLSPGELNRWKKRLTEALAPNSKVIVDIIPELGSIIGVPPPVPVLGSAEALNRFNLTFQKFIRVFAGSEHPLVLFIDDWQWADSATLSLLSSLMTDHEISHLLFIGAYRDTEVSGNHPFMIKLEEILQHRQTAIASLSLSPLHLNDITRFLGDALFCSEERAWPLAELIHRKTRGNPFFIKQFAQILATKELLFFDRENGRWSWDLDGARAMEAADNVVDLMLHQFQNLPEDSRHELQLASCIGNQFDIETLATISDSSPAKSFASLRHVVEQGYLLPLDNNYKFFWLGGETGRPAKVVLKFAHDKIQQAAYDLAAREERKPIHLTIGRMLLKKYGESGPNDRVFDIVDQFNQALDLITDRNEKELLVRLNLAAALKAKNSAAYGSAADYLEKGCAMLPEDTWQKNYNLTRNLLTERAEVEYLVGKFDSSERLISRLLDNVKTNIEKAGIYNLYIIQKTMSADFTEAIDAGRKALQLLGISLPQEGLDRAFEDELQKSYENLGNTDIAELINLPDMQDERRQLQIQVLTNLCSPAYRSDQALFRILVVKAVNIALEHGLTKEVCYTFSAYGILRGSLLGDHDIGYRFGLLALNISEKYNNPTQACRANFILSSTLVHWVHHAREADAFSDRCYTTGLDSGEFQFAGYILTYKLTNLIFQGKNLASLQETADNYLLFVQKTKNRWAMDMIQGTQMVLDYLLDLIDDSSGFSHSDQSEQDFYRSCHTIDNFSALCRYHIFKTLALCVMGKYRQAREAIEEAGKWLPFLFGTIYFAGYIFADSLSLTGFLDQCNIDERPSFLTRIRENQEKMQTWAKSCPENFAHRFLLIEAELARISGDALAAMELYDQAIGQAEEGGFIQNEAIGNELAANFWLARNKPEIARIYQKKAYYGYRRWGALRKLRQMEELFPELAAELAGEEAATADGMHIDETVTLDHLDVDMLVKALQTISGEIILENLLERLMSFVVMDAGADRGALFIKKKGHFYLEAEIKAGEHASSLLHSIPMGKSRTPHSLIRYVARTNETMVIDDAGRAPLLEQDEYIENACPKSILCMPIVRQRQIKAILYLENKSTAQVFTPKRQKILALLGAQVAISLENAMLFEEINREVIDRRRAEQALRRSEERFRELADLLPQIIFEADPTGILTYLNRHGFSALGINREVFTSGVLIQDLAIPEDKETVEDNIRKILKGEAPRGNPYQLQRVDGSRFPVLIYSSRILHDRKVSGFRGIILDVTELKKTEAKLKSTRNYLDALFNTLPSILLSVDGEARIQKWNQAAITFSGFQRATVIGKSLWEHLPMLLPYKNKLEQTFITGEAVELYKQHVLPDAKKYFDIFFYPLSYEGEKGAAIRIDDVTELVNMDQQLNHAQKMETIGSLAGGLAHDFNNLLSGITGTISLIKAKSAMEQDIPRDILDTYVTTMETASNRAASLVKQLQMLSKKQPLSLSSFSLSNAVQNVVKICRNIIDKSIDIKTSYTAGDDLVEADQGQIEQVLLNICINAAHAMTIMRKPSETQGGTLSISMENYSADGPSPPLGHLQGAYLLLKIQDTGVGMGAETLSRIFDPFFTSKETGIGTGLGLSMAYNIIKQHRGVIDVSSELGIGTRFLIFLPKTKGQMISPVSTDTRLELGKGKGLILVIDDEQVVRTTAKALLEALGYTVLVAGDGNEGINMYQENREIIQVVLLDMAMPKKSGKEVFLELKQINPEIKVILSSGFRQDKRVEETMDLGICEFIQKPYSLEQLMETMERVLTDTGLNPKR